MTEVVRIIRSESSKSYANGTPNVRTCPHRDRRLAPVAFFAAPTGPRLTGFAVTTGPSSFQTAGVENFTLA